MQPELMLSIAANIIAIAYFAGSLKATQVHHAEIIKNLKEEVNAHFKRLELKQDKHNKLIERMVRVEAALEIKTPNRNN